MTEIVAGLMESLRAHLQDKMIDNVPDEYLDILEYQDDEGNTRTLKPWLVKVGRVFDIEDEAPSSVSSLTPAISVSIHSEDPDDYSSWRHAILTGGSSAANVGLGLEVSREIGGTEHWWRRFTVQFDCNFVDSNQSQTEALRLANVIRALLEKYCSARTAANTHGWDCGGLTDDFGESVQAPYVARSQCWEAGGPDDDFIVRGKVWVQVKTTRE